MYVCVRVGSQWSRCLPAIDPDNIPRLCISQLYDSLDFEDMQLSASISISPIMEHSLETFIIRALRNHCRRKIDFWSPSNYCTTYVRPGL
jgi:hypothetical protein